MTTISMTMPVLTPTHEQEEKLQAAGEAVARSLHALEALVQTLTPPRERAESLVFVLGAGASVNVLLGNCFASIQQAADARLTPGMLRIHGSFPDRSEEAALLLRGVDEFQRMVIQKLLTTNFDSLLEAARHENAEQRVKQLVQAIAPPDPLADVQLKVAAATVSLRREFLETTPVLTSAEVHANAGFPGGNPSQTVHRWRKAGKIFAINHGGRDLYPAFQFGQDSRPLPIIAEVLEILNRDTERSEWDNALWFTGESGWLDGAAPQDCLLSDPDGVKHAAEQEVLPDEY